MVEEKDKSEAQKASELKIEIARRAGGPFVAAATRSRLPMIFIDPTIPGNPIIFANESFIARTGFSRDEILGQDFAFLLGSRSDPELIAHINASFGNTFGHIYPEIGYYCKDGSIFWAITLTSPVFQGEDIKQYFISYLDVTERRKEENRLRFLTDELNHRTQNTLAIVQAIARQTLRGNAPQEVIAGFERRLIALSKAHALLGTEQWYGVALQDLVVQTLQPFGFSKNSEQFVIGGSAVRLTPSAALILAMGLHELATNAAKYGALSNEKAGVVDIHWSLAAKADGQEHISLTWQERGGPPVTPPKRKGFGSILIESVLAQDLDGKVEIQYNPEGVFFRIDIPANKAMWQLIDA